MWLAGSILLLSALILGCALTGHALFAFSSSFRRPLLALWFSPIAGLAIWTHAAALIAWTTGFPPPAAIPAMALLLALAAWILRRRWRSLLHDSWLLGPATLAGGFGLFSILARFRGFNPFNDAFTYLVHARWLQHHSYHEAVMRDVLQPALSQVYLYQAGHHRMGASFLLAWIQSLCGRDWPHDVYPAVVAASLACGGLAVSGAVSLAVPTHRRLALVLGLLPGLTLSGITFGAVHGFLPQTLGLAFSLAALALAAAGPQSWIPAAVCFSAQVYSYPEAIPFTAAGLAALLLHPAARRAALLTLALGTLLAAPEWPRVAHSLAYQVRSVAGVNAPFSAHEALEHASGFNAGPWQDRMSLFLHPYLNLIACLAVISLAAWGLRRARRTAPALALAAVTVVLALGWLWFRFGERNPWDGSLGNPWRQARAATYSAYPVLTLIACGLAAIWRKHARLRPTLAVLLSLWLGAGALQNWRLAAPRFSTMQEELKCTAGCWQQLSTLRRAAPSGSISLEGFGQDHSKLRRFLTYVLMDHAIVSEWSCDDYIGPNLPQTHESAPAPATWLLTPEHPLHFQPNPARPAP